jgi:hypothetical protein
MRSLSLAYSGALGGLVALALAGASCGGVSSADILFGGPGAGGSTGTGTMSGTTSSGQTGTSSGPTGTSSGHATTSSSGSLASSSSSSSSGSHESSASGGGPPPVACNGGTCKAGQVCCHNPADLGGDHCGTAGQCGSGYIEIDCSSPADCPGQICCAHYSKVGGMIEYTGISCAASCGPAGSTYVICTGNPSFCPPGTTCKPTSVLGNGYEICSN